MAVKFVGWRGMSGGSPSSEVGVLDGSTATTKDTLCYADTSNDVLKTATSSAGTTLTLYGVFNETLASGATTVSVTPLNESQLWEVDCTNNTATTQLYSRQILTDGATLNNSASDTATTASVFRVTEIVGAASDKKVRGYFIISHQVTA